MLILSHPAPVVKTRFAPSPTGYFHLGGARTALFAWAYSRQHHGQFIVRLEDTDQTRSQEIYKKDLLAGLQWLELDYDESYAQSARRARHLAQAQKLLARGQAYEQEGAIRLKISGAPDLNFNDLVAGPITVASASLEDTVLVRADQTPTYILANAVDDLDDGITHVIRGDDHLVNTAKQIQIFRGLGKPAPQYAHLPMILSPTGQKLSKRQPANNYKINPLVSHYRQEGYLPAGLINYLARLSWATGDEEIFTKNFLVKKFSFAGISRASARFDQSKLNWVNAQHMKALPIKTLLTAAGLATLSPAIGELLRPRCQTLNELKAGADYFQHPPDNWPELVTKLDKTLLPALIELQRALETGAWEAPAIKQALKTVAKNSQQAFAQLAMPFRLMITGRTATPDIATVASLLGRAETLHRLARGIKKLNEN